MILLRLSLFLLLSMTASSQTFTTRGTEFWTGFMENRVGIGNGRPRFAFFISADRNTTGEVSIPGMDISIPFTLQSNIVTKVLLPDVVLNAMGSENVERKGILIRSEDSIEVRAVHYRLFFSDASIVLPVGQLGSRYFAIGADDYSRISGSSLMVVASEDDTELEITPSVMTRRRRPAGVPYTITLDRGEIYQLLGLGSEDISGTSIHSTNGKRFALYGGAQAAWIECDGDSHVYDQLLPLEQWGLEYLPVPFKGRRDQLKIVASEDSTDVYLDCMEAIRLDRGEVYTADFTAPTRITATGPIGIAQYARGHYCGSATGGVDPGDPTMLVLAPIAQRLHTARFHSPKEIVEGAGFGITWNEHFVTVVASVSDTAGLRLDGVSISSQLVPFPSDPRYLQASIEISSGDHLLEAPNGVHAYAYGFGSYDAYSFSLGADTVRLAAASPLLFDYTAGSHWLAIAACDTLPRHLKLCSGGAFTFRASGDETMDAWRWDFGDGTTGSGSEVVHTFDSAGEYEVTLTAVGPDCTVREGRQDVVVDDCRRDAPSELMISPNPTKRSLSITSIVRRRSLVTLELLAANGSLLGILSQQMLEPGIHATTVDMGDRPSGVYYLRGSFDDEVVIRKIVRTE